MAKLFGTAAGEEISGGAADDVIKGFGGNDSLWARSAMTWCSAAKATT